MAKLRLLKLLLSLIGGWVAMAAQLNQLSMISPNTFALSLSLWAVTVTIVLLQRLLLPRVCGGQCEEDLQSPLLLSPPPLLRRSPRHPSDQPFGLPQ